VLKLFARCARGNVAVIVALTLPIVIAGAGLGVEVGFWRYDQVRLQQAADAASYAAAVALREGTGTASDAATAAASQNGYSNASDTITVNTPSTATPTDANSVEAVIQRTETPFFSGLFTRNATRIQAASTATFTSAADACILALSHNAAAAADFSGNSSLTLSGCTVMSDSISSSALNTQGSATVSVPCMYAVGGASLGGTVNLTSCASVQTSQPPVGDPYASAAIPAPSGSCQSQPSGGGKKKTLVLPSGYYCGLDLDDTSLSGTYWVDSGGLSINANATVSGAGVTIILMNGASVSMNGNSDVQISAPTSGATKGFLFMSYRNSAGSITINGDNTSAMTGIIYAPASRIFYTGNFSGAGGCTQIVANTVAWSGSTTFNDDCSAAGFGHIQIGSVRLSA
jgi:Flp pilus assembly protein TadG